MSRGGQILNPACLLATSSFVALAKGSANAITRQSSSLPLHEADLRLGQLQWGFCALAIHMANATGLQPQVHPQEMEGCHANQQCFTCTRQISQIGSANVLSPQMPGPDTHLSSQGQLANEGAVYNGIQTV